jgi:outer membrane protein assembly factor BamA
MGGAGTMRGFFDDSLIPEDRRETLHEQIGQCAGAITKTGCSAAADALRNGNTLLSDGGELYTMGRAELRVPLFSPFELAIFLDTGNLWLDRSKYDPFKLRYAGGFGLRAVTPIGPAAIDLGINLDPDRELNESRFVPHFSIGVF